MSKEIVVQANELIENKADMSVNEQRLFYSLIRTINKDDEEFKDLQIPIKNICDEWELEGNSAYKQISDAMTSLSKKSFEKQWIDDKGKVKKEVISYLSYASYTEGSGYVTVRIDKAMKPYLLQLSERFTSIQFEIMKKLNSNAMRIYELLKSFEWISVWTVENEKLREYLGIEKDKYPNNSNFETKVIKPALKQINEFTELNITYEKNGRGKFVTYAFHIGKNKDFDFELLVNKIEEEQREKQAEPTISKKELYENNFNELWKLYPSAKKKGKGSVSYTTKEKLYNIGFDELKRALERYVKEYESINDNNYRFLKNGSTFFNSGYVDYLDENYEEMRAEDVRKIKGTGNSKDHKREEYDDIEKEAPNWFA